MALDLTCLQMRQAKRRLGGLFRGWLALGDDFEVRRGDGGGVGVLKEHAAGDLPGDWRGGGGVDLDETEVLFGGEDGECFRGEGGGGDGFYEELGDDCCRFGVDRVIDADDAAEGGDGVGGEGFFVGLEDGMAGGGSAGVGVLDDGDGRFVEFFNEGPAGIEVDEIVVAEFFALELAGVGYAQAGAVGVKGGALVGVLAVAEAGGLGQVDAEGCGEVCCCGEGAVWFWSVGDFVERIGDGGVVGGGGGEGLFGETPAGFAG